MTKDNLIIARRLFTAACSLRWQVTKPERKAYDCIMDAIYEIPGAFDTSDWMNG